MIAPHADILELPTLPAPGHCVLTVPLPCAQLQPPAAPFPLAAGFPQVYFQRCISSRPHDELRFERLTGIQITPTIHKTNLETV